MEREVPEGAAPPPRPLRHTLVVGVTIAVLGIANSLKILPAWFWMGGLLAPLAAGFLTARIVRSRSHF